MCRREALTSPDSDTVVRVLVSVRCCGTKSHCRLHVPERDRTTRRSNSQTTPDPIPANTSIRLPYTRHAREAGYRDERTGGRRLGPEKACQTQPYACVARFLSPSGRPLVEGTPPPSAEPRRTSMLQGRHGGGVGRRRDVRTARLAATCSAPRAAGQPTASSPLCKRREARAGLSLVVGRSVARWDSGHLRHDTLALLYRYKMCGVIVCVRGCGDEQHRQPVVCESVQGELSAVSTVALETASRALIEKHYCQRLVTERVRPYIRSQSRHLYRVSTLTARLNADSESAEELSARHAAQRSTGTSVLKVWAGPTASRCAT
ncbi:hypothetical protein C8Q80DRAFT_357428 [Daedaleopsis nitida]|nr:hypothetical protein C8Q80DRAFT_357428 [Daedaleopsis nitida]